MSLNVGTLVRPYQTGDSDSTDGSEGFTCNQDICIGIITEFLEPDGGAKTDAEVLVRVKWLQMCMMHANRYYTPPDSPFLMVHRIDDLWEIGQTR